MDPEIDIKACLYHRATSALANRAGLSRTEIRVDGEMLDGNVAPAQRSALSCLKSSQTCWVQSLDTVTRDGWPRRPKGAAHWVMPEAWLLAMIRAPHGPVDFI